jgi:hypothetical protein
LTGMLAELGHAQMPMSLSPRLIDLPVVPSEIGELAFIQANRLLPFAIRRVYYVYDIPEQATRGGHAHRKCHELLVAMAGAMTVNLEAQDGTRSCQRIDDPAVALYVPALYWRVIDRYAPGTICLVLASEDYDPGEYLRDYDEFRRYRDSGHDPVP